MDLKMRLKRIFYQIKIKLLVIVTDIYSLNEQSAGSDCNYTV